ncbi:MAG: cation transporter [Microscillaceae bacterium]|nr:cation transporter [Microscillaceae bacterium]
MKVVKFLFCALLVIAFTVSAQAQDKKEKAKNKTEKVKGKADKVSKGKAKGNQEISIVTSAQCEMCKERIEKALNETPGIKMANLDLETKAIKVVYNSNKISADQIRQAIANTGYDADNVGANEKAYSTLPACCKKGGH